MPDKEVIAMYDGCHVPLENMSDFYGKVGLISSPPFHIHYIQISLIYPFTFCSKATLFIPVTPVINSFHPYSQAHDTVVLRFYPVEPSYR